MSDAMVKVPGVGPVKKQHVYVGGALVAGIVGYAWWARGTTVAEDIPAYTEEDVISDGVTDTPGGAAGGGANSGGAEWDNSTAPDTDAEWVMAARDALIGVFDDAEFSIALGRYIARQTLTAIQADMIRAAIGAVGYPPGGNYPIDTVGGSNPSALIEPKNLRLWTGAGRGATGASHIALQWDPVPGASDYRIHNASGGDSVGASTDTKHYVENLRPGTSYTFTVRAVANGKEGPASMPFTAKTSGAYTPVTPANPGPTKPSPSPSKPSTPRHRTVYITKRGQTLSHLVADYNRKYKTRHTVSSVWAFNLKYRPANTVAELKKRGPDRVYIGTSFWIPF